MGTYLADLNRMMLVLSEFREIADNMQTQQAQCLLCVALKPGCTKVEMSNMTGLSLSSCSRNMNTLSKWKKPATDDAPAEPGFDLVDLHPDQEDGRRNAAWLNANGKAKLRKIIAILRPNEVVAYDPPSAPNIRR